MSLTHGAQRWSRRSSRTLADGHWHHIVVEIQRTGPAELNIYIDGQRDSTHPIESAISRKSLSNNGNFLVGKSPTGLFKGKLDFLRISKGALADADTDIGELYNWEFDGPFLLDFNGHPSYGRSRDIGAVEYIP